MFFLSLLSFFPLSEEMSNLAVNDQILDHFQEGLKGPSSSILGVNFTNILRAAFTRADPKNAKKLFNLTVFFALLGSSRVKAARRMLVKLNQGGELEEGEKLASKY